MRSFLPTAVLLAGVAWCQDTEPSHCCDALRDAGLQESLVFPDNVAAFETSVDKYFSKTARLKPQCFLEPQNAQEVSRAVTALVAANKTEPCQFAVRSGGHMSFAGAAGIENGVTIDLVRMKDIEYSKEDGSIAVGAGALWGDVYEVLDELNLMVTGARSSSVGVGGSTLGGGNSFFAARYGFICDNVLEFEIVLGNGTVATASKEERSDLFQALKGGGSNFGIVTKIVLPTFEGGKFFGGVVLYPIDTADQQLQAISNFGNSLHKDHYASAIVIDVYDSTTKMSFFMNAYEYTKPVERPDAKIFKEFFAIPGNISDTTGLRNTTSLANEFDVPKDSRVQFSTLTFKNDIRVLKRAHESFLKVRDKLAAEAKGPFGIFTLFQPIPKLFSDHSNDRGGNVLGLDRFDDTLIMYEPYLKWQNEDEDELFESQAQWLRDDISTYAASVGSDNDWLYLNYADISQKPLEGYGAENVAKIRAAAQRYDPDGVFQYMMPGGFKVSRVSDHTQQSSTHSEL
ncbi:putative FAD-binding domain, PCMH-type, FAD-binding, type PCMH, subdomain 2 [Septoria linicola]|nr:putative FAD-binding domain, PCMH-type, FAD-binding, type PCMH, subdomain 2 [Septoria linicola]